MRAKAEAIRAACAKNGVDLLIYCTLRDPYEQARHYRKSRTIQQIIAKAHELTDRGYHNLANVLIHVGPQPGKIGRHITWAGPGESWHQYRQAFDAVPMCEGKCLWSFEDYQEEWEIYGQAVEAAGLRWGGRFRDYPHAQSSQRDNPLDVLSYDQVTAQLIIDI